MNEQKDTMTKRIRLSIEGDRTYAISAQLRISPADQEVIEKRAMVEEMIDYLANTHIDKMNWVLSQRKMMEAENLPVDAIAMDAEAIVKAAIEWKRWQGERKPMTREEWLLDAACDSYGYIYKGLRSS